MAGEQQTVQHGEQMPRALQLAQRIILASTGVMFLLSAIFCIWKAATNNSIYGLLFMNIIISTLLTSFMVLWQNKGCLGMRTHWILIVVGVAMIWQCIATNIYVFNAPDKKLPPMDGNSTTGNITDFTSPMTYTISPSIENQS